MRHGGHAGAQKLSSTTRPRSVSSLSVPPSISLPENEGADSPGAVAPEAVTASIDTMTNQHLFGIRILRILALISRQTPARIVRRLRKNEGVLGDGWSAVRGRRCRRLWWIGRGPC